MLGPAFSSPMTKNELLRKKGKKKKNLIIVSYLHMCVYNNLCITGDAQRNLV